MITPTDIIRCNNSSIAEFIAVIIMGLTIKARASYDDDPDQALDSLKAINEDIHRLSGHLARLATGEIEMDQNTASLILAVFKTLPDSLQQPLLQKLHSGPQN